MRAVVVEHPGGPDALTLVDVPRPEAGEDEVVVEVEAVGVNPVDLGNRADPSWAGISPPYVVGYELAGLVVDTGEPVWGLLPVQGTTCGAMAERVAVPRRYLEGRDADGSEEMGRRAPRRVVRRDGGCVDLRAGTSCAQSDPLRCEAFSPRSVWLS